MQKNRNNIHNSSLQRSSNNSSENTHSCSSLSPHSNLLLSPNGRLPSQNNFTGVCFQSLSHFQQLSNSSDTVLSQDDSGKNFNKNSNDNLNNNNNNINDSRKNIYLITGISTNSTQSTNNNCSPLFSTSPFSSSSLLPTPSLPALLSFPPYHSPFSLSLHNSPSVCEL